MKVMRCACLDPDHCILIDSDEFGVYVHTGANGGGFWNRVVYAFHHVFGRTESFASTILEDEKDVEELISYLDSAKNKMVEDREELKP